MIRRLSYDERHYSSPLDCLVDLEHRLKQGWDVVEVRLTGRLRVVAVYRLEWADLPGQGQQLAEPVPEAGGRPR